MSLSDVAVPFNGDAEQTMTPQQQNIVDEGMNLLIQEGSLGMADFFRRIYEIAMQLERQQFMNAAPYQRTSERNGYANCYKPKKS